MAANALVNRESQAWNTSLAKFESDQKKSLAIQITCLVVGALGAFAVLVAIGIGFSSILSRATPVLYISGITLGCVGLLTIPLAALAWHRAEE